MEEDEQHPGRKPLTSYCVGSSRLWSLKRRGHHTCQQPRAREQKRDTGGCWWQQAQPSSSSDQTKQQWPNQTAMTQPNSNAASIKTISCCKIHVYIWGWLWSSDLFYWSRAEMEREIETFCHRLPCLKVNNEIERELCKIARIPNSHVPTAQPSNLSNYWQTYAKPDSNTTLGWPIVALVAWQFWAGWFVLQYTINLHFNWRDACLNWRFCKTPPLTFHSITVFVEFKEISSITY